MKLTIREQTLSSSVTPKFQISNYVIELFKLRKTGSMVCIMGHGSRYRVALNDKKVCINDGE